MIKITLLEASIGDIAYLRCGGYVTIDRIALRPDGATDYMYRIGFEGWPVIGAELIYNVMGICGDGTGRVECPFDIVAVIRPNRGEAIIT